MPSSHSGYLELRLETGRIGYWIFMVFIYASLHLLEYVRRKDPVRAWGFLSIQLFAVMINLLDSNWLGRSRISGCCISSSSRNRSTIRGQPGPCVRRRQRSKELQRAFLQSAPVGRLGSPPWSYRNVGAKTSITKVQLCQGNSANPKISSLGRHAAVVGFCTCRSDEIFLRAKERRRAGCRYYRTSATASGPPIARWQRSWSRKLRVSTLQCGASQAHQLDRGCR